jgi:hypothetical protein
MKQCSVRFAVLIAIATLCYAGVGETQVASDPPAWFASVHADLTGIKYPALARQAQISGTTRFRVNPGAGEIAVESGHALLVAVAKENLAKWRFDRALSEPLTVDYIFRLTEDTGDKSTKVEGPTAASSGHRVIVVVTAQAPHWVPETAKPRD